MPVGFSGKVLDRCWNKTYHRLRSGATKQTYIPGGGGTKSSQVLRSEVTDQRFLLLVRIDPLVDFSMEIEKCRIVYSSYNNF